MSDVDPLTDLLGQLTPALLEVAKAAVAESMAAVPSVTYRPGVVTGVSAAERTASVLIDGDTTATTVQVLDQLPWQNARVMVRFVPPSAVFLDGIISASPLPAGVMMPYGGPITVHADAASATPTSNQPPPGWLWCAGQAVSRATYSALFAAIGVTYGSGDGATTFNVPDLRGRTIVGLDNMGGTDAGRLSSANTLGTTGGAETHTLSTAQLPSHNHDAGTLGTNTTGSHSHTDSGHTHPNGWGTTYVAAAGATYPAAGSDTAVYSGTGYANLQSNGSHSHTVSGSTGSAGSGSSVNHMPPFASVHWIIRA